MTAFDNQLYVAKQTEKILQRISQYDKLYLEFGGKLFDDLHASRVLPGFDANNKVKILSQLADKAEVLMCISSHDILSNKVRADHGITYSMELNRVIDKLRERGIYVSAIVITKYNGQQAVDLFRKQLQANGERVYCHSLTKGYPLDVDAIVSDEGYGANEYIPTTRPLVIVTAPGPGSGKLATCLTQLYHEYKHGNNSGYAKFETFPIWNLPLSHPVNVAYEAATADIMDVNMIDHFHLNAYNEQAVNYNRDLETFPVVSSILTKILGKSVYKSPTDMGVNMAASGIVDDAACQQASKQEVIRRFFHALVDYKLAKGSEDAVNRLKYLMRQLGISPSDRATVDHALQYEQSSGCPTACIELDDGTLILGKQSEIMTCTSAVVVNAIKHIANINDSIKLLPPQIMEPILSLNTNLYKSKKQMMTLSQTLVALTVSQPYNNVATIALEQLPSLVGCQIHTTHIVSESDRSLLRKMGLELTMEPRLATEGLFVEQ